MSGWCCPGILCLQWGIFSRLDLRQKEIIWQSSSYDNLKAFLFEDLFLPNEAARLEIRAVLLAGLTYWQQDSGIEQEAAAQGLGIIKARITEIKRDEEQFTLDVLVMLASNAGLNPSLQFKITKLLSWFYWYNRIH